MRFFYTFHTAFEGLRRNRSRSALTVLGIVIGIAAVMLVMSIGSSAQNLILSQIQGRGTRPIAVLPGRQPTGPSDAAQLFSDSLKARDLDLLRRKENDYLDHAGNVYRGLRRARDPAPRRRD